VILSNLLLQVFQVLCVLLLAPLLQGFIRKVEERVQRSRGPSLFQPYRDLWKLLHKQSVVPESASWIYLIAPVVAFTAMLIVPILIPVLTDRPLPLSDMGDMLGGGMVLTLGSFAVILAGLDTGNAYGGIGSSRAVMLGILAEPTLILVLVGISLLAKAMLPFVVIIFCWEFFHLLEPRTPLPGPGILCAAAGRNGPLAHPLQHPHRDLHD